MGRKPLILESNFPFLHPRPPLSLDELNSMAALIVTQILILLTMPLVCRSAFTNASDSRWCWGSNCVEQKSPGHICYFPAGNQTNATSCSGGHSGDSEYQAVLIAHLSQSLSIGYYMPVTNTWLGGVNYSLSSLAPNTSITLCLSGQVGLDNEYQTLCESANADNDITLPGPYCIVTIAQHYVSDHCYTAMPNQTTASNVTSTPTSNGLSTSDKIALGTSISFGLPGLLVLLGGIWKKQRIRAWWKEKQMTTRLRKVFRVERGTKVIQESASEVQDKGMEA